MIETHVVNALLRPELKSQPFFSILTFANGLVAPSFLFCAGVALAITLHKRWNEYIMLRKTFWRYLVRIVFIFVIGYSLHVPFFSLTRMRSLTEQSAWVSFFQVDILQTIAVTLLLLLVLAIAVRKEDRFFWVSVVVTTAVIFISPIVRGMDHSALPIWFRPYLSSDFRSQFPFFPWGAFVSSGTIVGFWFLRWRESGREKEMIRMLTVLSVTAIVVSLIAEVVPVAIYPHHNFWRSSPQFFFIRLALVALSATALWAFEQRHAAAHRSVVSLFGQESLLVYVVHLLIVYGYTYRFSFVRLFGPTLEYWQCFALFLGLTGAMYLLAFVWHTLKAWNFQKARLVQAAAFAGIVLTFLLQES